MPSWGGADDSSEPDFDIVPTTPDEAITGSPIHRTDAGGASPSKGDVGVLPSIDGSNSSQVTELIESAKNLTIPNKETSAGTPPDQADGGSQLFPVPRPAGYVEQRDSNDPSGGPFLPKTDLTQIHGRPFQVRNRREAADDRLNSFELFLLPDGMLKIEQKADTRKYFAYLLCS